MVDTTNTPLELDEHRILTQITDQLTRARGPHDRAAAVWRENRRQYANEHDFSEKAPWQTKGYLPKHAKDSDFIANSLTEALGDQQASTFNLDGEDEDAELVTPILTDLINYNLEREQYDETFEGALRDGLQTSGMLLKVRPEARPADGDYPHWPGYALIEPCPQDRLFRDPTGRNKWSIYITPMDYDDALRLALDNGWNVENLEQLKGAAGTGGQRQDDERQWKAGTAESCGLDLDTEDGYRNTVFVLEYYGPIYGEGGEVVIPFGYAVAGNNKVLLKAPEARPPFGDNKDCFIRTDIIGDPFSVYPKSYMADSRGISENQTRLINMALDQMAMSVSAYEYDPEAFTPAALRKLQSARGLPGGMMLERSRPLAQGPGIAPVVLGQFNPATIELHSVLDRERQEATSATDLVRGTPAQNTPDMTASEFTGKRLGATSSLRSISRGIERRGIVPTVQRLLHYYRFYGLTLENAVVARVASKSIKTAVEKVLPRLPNFQPVEGDVEQHPLYGLALGYLDRLIQETEWTVTATGLSGVLERQETAQMAIQLLTVVAGLPGGALIIETPEAADTLARLMGLAWGNFGSDDVEAWRQAMQAMSQPPPQDTGPKMSISIAFADLPPDAQAGLLQQLGLPFQDAAMGLAQPPEPQPPAAGEEPAGKETD